MKGCVDVTSGDEKALQQAVASVGPISVGMDAGHDSFNTYSGGECSQGPGGGGGGGGDGGGGGSSACFNFLFEKNIEVSTPVLFWLSSK